MSEEMIINTCKVATYVTVKKLKFHPSNSELRSISPERFAELKNSLINKGFYEPILVWKKGGVVLAGNQRLKAAQELIAEGYTFMTPDGQTNALPVVIEDVDEKMAMQILHQANNHHGDWVSQKLAEAIKEASELGISFGDLGYSEEDHERIMEEALASINTTDDDEREEPLTGDDEVPVAPKVPTAKRGDVWTLGNHRLMCGDSTSLVDVEKLMNGRLASMVFTDPPYGVAYQSNMRTKSAKFEVIKNDEVFISKWIDVLPVVSGGWVFVWTTWKVIKEWMEICKPIGDMTNVIVWDKGGGGIGDLKKTFSTDYEIALVYNRGAEITGKRLGSVWSIGKDGAASYLHPTQKPVELAQMALENCTNKSDNVLDLFLGSGSTLIACEKTGRHCFGMELDEVYCDVIIERWENYTGRKAVKEKAKK